MDCRSCTDGRLERLDDASDQTTLQRERGCHAEALAPFALDGEDLLRCPIKRIDWAAIRPVLEAWRHLAKGRYPCAGGYADQPALFLDILEEVDALEAENSRQPAS